MSRIWVGSIAVVTSLLSSVAHAPDGAARGLANTIHPAEFETAETFRGPRRILAAAVFINFQNQHFCSGSIISDDGLILTANHCLGTCQESCALVINGQPTIGHVVMRAKCSSEDYEREISVRFARFFPRAIEPACDGTLDIAIIRPERPPPDYSCLPVGSEHHVGDQVYAMGFPSRTTRGAMDSDGRHLHLSYGQIIARQPFCRVRSNKDWFEFFLRVRQPGSRIDISRFNDIDALTKNPDLQTTVDAVERSSGSPLINEKGEVIAVASNIISAHNSGQECAGATFFAPWSALSGAQMKIAPDFDVESIRCEDKRAVPRSVPL